MKISPVPEKRMPTASPRFSTNHSLQSHEIERQRSDESLFKTERD